MAQNDDQKVKGPKENKNQLLIRYGLMGFFGWFTHNGMTVEKTRTKVVIKTKRGLELGDIVGPFCYKGGHFKNSCAEIDKYYEGSSKDYPLAGGGTFVRYATQEDIMENEHLEVSSRRELKCAQNMADEMELPMKMVDAEHLLGGERIVIYFTSESRVDFRELVKRLAKEYQTRIELRQIGARDEARIIADFESCGQECCCKRFLKILAPVNMRMAKTQKATLDPSKISGHCGRLKCCLRYEDNTYKELKKNLPHRSTIVKTDSGEGKVIDSHILTQLVVVQLSDGRREAFPANEVEILTKKELDERAKPGNEEQAQKQQADKQPVQADKENNKPSAETETDNTGSAESSEEKPQSDGQKPDETVKSSGEAGEKPKKKRRRRRRRKKPADGEQNSS